MNLKKVIFFIVLLVQLYACADYKTAQDKEKQYYSSKGFALVYEVFANHSTFKDICLAQSILISAQNIFGSA